MPDIHIGNQTAFSAASAMEPFDYALDNGFDAFEWFPDKKISGAGWDEQDLPSDLRSQIRTTALIKRIRLSVHGRWDADPLDPKALALLLKDVELAQDLGARLFNIHLYPDKGVDVYLKAIAPLIRRTAAAGVQLAIENSPENAPEHFNQFFKLLRRQAAFPSMHVGMCFDLGHANLCATTRNDYLKYFLQLDASIPIIHLHLHENWGDSDSHLPLFTGPAGEDPAGLRKFIAKIQARYYRGSIILEGWPKPPTLLKQAREKLLELLAKNDEDAGQ